MLGREDLVAHVVERRLDLGRVAERVERPLELWVVSDEPACDENAHAVEQPLGRERRVVGAVGELRGRVAR